MVAEAEEILRRGSGGVGGGRRRAPGGEGGGSIDTTATSDDAIPKYVGGFRVWAVGNDTGVILRLFNLTHGDAIR